MARITWLICLVLLAAGNAVAAEVEMPPLYRQVTGGEEEYEVPGRTTLNRVALEKGVQWQVVARHNDLEKPYKLKQGMVLRINNTRIVPTELSYGFVINLPELALYHVHDGDYQRRYALAVGKRSWPTPTGDYHIRNKTRNPTWTVPPSIQAEMEAQGQEVVEKVPPGPKNPLGAFWMGTSAPGVGIHATNRPWSVGHSVSHGCIRMLPDEIEGLFPQVEVGLPVKIIYRPIKLAVTPQGRIYLEANPNIYQWKLHALELVQEIAREHGLTDRIDWEKVPDILKAREGIARDITTGRSPTDPATTRKDAAGPGEARLSPLQGREATVE